MTDQFDIQTTISLYHEGASKPDLEQVVATFVPNGIWEVPSLRYRFEGHADIGAGMAGLLEPFEFLVQVNAPAIISVDGDNATARTIVREAAKFKGQPGIIDVFGQFNDELQRTAEGWKFARRNLTILGSHMSAEL